MATETRERLTEFTFDTNNVQQGDTYYLEYREDGKRGLVAITITYAGPNGIRGIVEDLTGVWGKHSGAIRFRQPIRLDEQTDGVYGPDGRSKIRLEVHPIRLTRVRDSRCRHLFR